MCNSSVLAIVVAFYFSVALQSPSAASTLSFNYTGTIIGVFDTDQNGTPFPFPSEIAEGDSLFGTFTYELSVPDSNFESHTGQYVHLANPSPSGLSGTIPSVGWSFSNDSSKDLTVTIVNTTATDKFIIATDSTSSGISLDLATLSFELHDTSASVFDSDSLPTALNVENFDDRILFIRGEQAGEKFGIVATIDSITLVPEPMTLTLTFLGLSVISMSCRKRGWHRQSAAVK